MKQYTIMLPTSSDNDALYNIALTMVPEIGVKTARGLLNKFGTAADIFKASAAELKKTDGVGEVRAKMFKEKSILLQAEKELSFVTKNHIELLSFGASNYPKRLQLCDDAPILLYYKGNTDLNATKTISIVGTRKCTEYGHRLTEHLVEGLNSLNDIIVVSGLAAGIDTIAHKTAVKNAIPTVGVLGHGLDHIYPFTNKSLAKDMLSCGGLLSEYPSGTQPDRQNFPVRNRIVAGMADVTVVVESGVKGGAMITAYMALSYNRDVAAFPGRVFDGKSDGPNHLIKRNMATCISDAADVLTLMNWAPDVKKNSVQQHLFLDLSEDEKTILQLLKEKEKVHADELQVQSQFKPSLLASVLLQLEMQGVIKSLPGKYYRVM